MTLAVACDGGGGGKPQDDAAVDAGDVDDGSVQPKPDSGMDEPGTDAGMDADVVDPGTDAGMDADVVDPDGGQPEGGMGSRLCTGAGTAIARATGGSVASDDGRVVLDIAPNALSANATVWVCEAPAGSVSAAITAEQPVGAVYVVESTLDGVAGRLRYELDDALETALTQGANGLAPVVLRGSSGEAGTTLAAAELSLRGGTWEASGDLSGEGFVYLRHLDASGARYAVDLRVPSGDRLTGEVFDAEARVSVLGTPQQARNLEVLVAGCELEPLQLRGTQSVTQAACGEQKRVLRAGADIDSDYADGQLEAGRVFDLTSSGAAASHLPPRFFCAFPGAATAEVALRFVREGAPELTVRGLGEVTCKLSLDRLAAADQRRVSRVQHGPLLPTTWPEGTAVHGTQVLVSDADTLSLFEREGDGAYRNNTTVPTSEAPFASVRFASGLNAVTVSHVGDHYEEESAGYEQPGHVFFAEGAAQTTLTAEFGEHSLEVDVASFEALDLSFGAPAGASTRFSFADGSVDLVVVRGLNGSDLLFERWLKPSRLPLQNGKRSARLLEDAAAGAGVEYYRIEFYNVTWDVERVAWSGGRVLPLLGGHAVHMLASDLEPEKVADTACPAAPVTSGAGCVVGPYEALLVATESGLELFDAVDGRYLGPAFQQAGHTQFKHVVQGPGGCLYASRHGATPGVYRYRPTTSGFEAIDASDAPFIGADQVQGVTDNFIPNSLVFGDDSLFIANGGGHVIAVDSSGTASRHLDNAALVATGLVREPYADGLAVANQGGSLGSHTVTAIPPLDSGEGPFDVRFGLSGPEQIAYLPAVNDQSPENITQFLLAEAFGGANGGRARSLTLAPDEHGNLLADVVYYEFTGGQEPRGVWPLLTPGRWLVAGTNGLGVQVVNAGFVAQSATPVGDFSDVDAQYISRVCLGFDPSAQ